MKKIILSLGLGFLILSSHVVAGESSQKVVIKKADLLTRSIEVKGMFCMGCEAMTKKNLLNIKGVVDAKASHKNEEVVVTYDKTKVDKDMLFSSIKKSGYEAIKFKE
ncbi:MAG: heavy-metal-associated domain-containing protein [Sulfurovum sp.]|nr:heavy-metal-associated domain-containing protein [Sulfurovum sp.]